jgi:hypothetical protein
MFHPTSYSSLVEEGRDGGREEVVGLAGRRRRGESTPLLPANSDSKLGNIDKIVSVDSSLILGKLCWYLTLIVLTSVVMFIL